MTDSTTPPDEDTRRDRPEGRRLVTDGGEGPGIGGMKVVNLGLNLLMFVGAAYFAVTGDLQRAGLLFAGGVFFVLVDVFWTGGLISDAIKNRLR